MVLLCKGGENLDGMRLKRFHVLVARSKTSIHPKNLPPTSGSTMYHSLRVFCQVHEWNGNTLCAEQWGGKFVMLILSQFILIWVLHQSHCLFWFGANASQVVELCAAAADVKDLTVHLLAQSAKECVPTSHRKKQKKKMTILHSLISKK